MCGKCKDVIVEVCDCGMSVGGCVASVPFSIFLEEEGVTVGKLRHPQEVAYTQQAVAGQCRAQYISCMELAVAHVLTCS